MKKTIAILLVICSIAAIFAGCSKSNPIDEIIADQAAETPAADAGTDIAPEKEETPEKEPAEKAKPFELGTVNGDTYESAYFGIGFKGEGWIFDSAEDVAQANGITEDMTPEEVQEVFENSAYMDDLGAESDDSRCNVYMTVENLKLSASSDIDENGQADLYEAEIKSAIEEMNGENIVITRGIGHIGEDTHPVINMEYDYQNLHIYQRVFFVKEGNYLAAVSITSIDQEGLDDVIGRFYKL